MERLACSMWPRSGLDRCTGATGSGISLIGRDGDAGLVGSCSTARALAAMGHFELAPRVHVYLAKSLWTLSDSRSHRRAVTMEHLLAEDRAIELGSQVAQLSRHDSLSGSRLFRKSSNQFGRLV